MRLLLDQNLSVRILAAIADIFPGSAHVRDLGLARADDRTIWDYARDHGFAIATKDGDFQQMSFLYGPPPKVVWLRGGNRSTDETISLIRQEALLIAEFLQEGEEAILIVGPDR